MDIRAATRFARRQSDPSAHARALGDRWAQSQRSGDPEAAGLAGRFQAAVNALAAAGRPDDAGQIVVDAITRANLPVLRVAP